MPCSDDWLSAVANLPASLGRRFPASVSRAAVHAFMDKWHFANLLNSLHLPHPQTHLLCSSDELAALDFAFDEAILKPLSSVHFVSRRGVKGYPVRSHAEVLAALGGFDFPIMLQEFIPGPANNGYFLDGFRDRKGHIGALFARQRLRMPTVLRWSTWRSRMSRMPSKHWRLCSRRSHTAESSAPSSNLTNATAGSN
jgi:D-aspartate ligase